MENCNKGFVMKNSMRHINSFINNRVKRFFTFGRLGNYQGFNLVELMIVVAIVGILAAVSVPLYQAFIQKSRVKALVYPALHIIESNVALYYGMSGTLPGPSHLPALWAEADTRYINVSLPGSALVLTIDAPGRTSKLHALDNMDLVLTPVTSGLKISSWDLSGELAIKLGIDNE